MAIKKIEKAFDHKVYARQTLRELKICRLLKHENVLLFCLKILYNSINKYLIIFRYVMWNKFYYLIRGKNLKTCFLYDI